MLRGLGRKARNGNKKLKKEVFLSDKTPFAVKETYKVARTNIMFSMPGEGCKVVVVSSAYPEEGKTTTCTNLALTFAQTGERVLIIDCDLRRPQIHHVFDTSPLVGLSNVLGGFCSVEDAIIQVEESNLHIIPAGHIPPNPAELLASQEMKGLLEVLSQRYDYIFVDTPPLNVVTDAVLLSSIASGTVVVAKQGFSYHKDIQRALQKLEFANAKVLGLIMTGEKRKTRSYGKYNRSGYYGGYRSYEQSE